MPPMTLNIPVKKPGKPVKWERVKFSGAVKQKALPRLKGRISTSAVFKRQLVRQKDRHRLLDELRVKLKDNGFFSNLPALDFRYTVGGSIRKYSFVSPGSGGATNVAIKDVYYQGENDRHGENFEEIRRKVSRAHAIARKGVFGRLPFIVRTPKVYGVITTGSHKYLIMECVEDKKSELIRAHNSLFFEAFFRLESTYKLQGLQTFHFIPAGIENGVVVFYVAYDRR